MAILIIVSVACDNHCTSPIILGCEQIQLQAIGAWSCIGNPSLEALSRRRRRERTPWFLRRDVALSLRMVDQFPLGTPRERVTMAGEA